MSSPPPGRSLGQPLYLPQLRTNLADCIATAVAGQIVHPLVRGTPYRIGRDGTIRVVPGSGGIVYNRRVGDPARGLVGDHVEPGVSLRNNDRDHLGGPGAANRAFLAYSCIGNRATVVSGPALGAHGRVIGKHGGINHVIVDFDPRILRALRIGDRIQVQAWGQGLALADYPSVRPLNLSPTLLRRWGIRRHGPHLHVPVTHVVPAGLMGSGLGRPDGVLGDCDIQLSNPAINRRFRLDSLRMGDLVALAPLDFRHGPSQRPDVLTIGVIVHSDSNVAGHGPGVTPLLVGPASVLRPWFRPDANLARVLALTVRRIRQLAASPERLLPLARLTLGDPRLLRVP